MYTNIIHNDDICNYFLKNQQFIFNSLGNCRECRLLSSKFRSGSSLPVLRTTKCDAFSEARRTKNRLLRYGMSIRCSKRPPGVRDASSEMYRAKSSLLPHRMHLQCAKRPPLSLFAPATPSLAPSTALGTRNAHRSEVIRLKRGCIPWKSLRIHPPHSNS